MSPLEEPLLESAPLARRIAPQLCRDPVIGTDCSPMHGFWQYLRLLGFVTTPREHAGFLSNALAQVVQPGRRIDVLISGAMDYSMLAHVFWACDLQRVAANVTVVDICETPLHLNRWYADRADRAVRTVCQDVLLYAGDAAFDVICTHSLLSQFTPSKRSELAVKWRHLLRPGGRVITVNRIRPGSGEGPFTYSDAQIKALQDALLSRLDQWRDRIEIDPAELARSASAYARHRRIYPVASCEDIAGLFEHAGFVVDHLSSAKAAPGPLHVSGPSDIALYAQLIARLP